MTESEEQKLIRFCYKNMDKFTEIYPKDTHGKELKWQNDMPKGVKMTVFCKSNNDEGFLINMTSDELGLEALIAQKWIIHSELEELYQSS